MGKNNVLALLFLSLSDDATHIAGQTRMQNADIGNSADNLRLQFRSRCKSPDAAVDNAL